MNTGMNNSLSDVETKDLKTHADTQAMKRTIRPILPDGHRPIVFFDGVCVMCNRFVDLMIRLDPKARLMLAPLQGETARQYLPPLPQNHREWTIYFLDDIGLCDRSEAFIRICWRLKNWVSIFSIIKLIPTPIRDAVYNLIARNRYQVFGKLEQCRIPTPEEQARFLP